MERRMEAGPRWCRRFLPDALVFSAERLAHPWKEIITENFMSQENEIGATCCASLGDNSSCVANPPKSERQIIAESHRERLNHGLQTLARWCASRAMLEHDTETTLTMLEKKAAELRGKVVKAGWAAIAEHSPHNAGSDARRK